MKRLLGMILTAAMFSQTIIAFAADGDSVSISPSGAVYAGMELTARATPSNDDFSFIWLESETEDGEYIPIIGADGEAYTLSTLDQGKYIKVKAVNNTDSSEVISTEAKTMSGLGPLTSTYFGNVNSTKDTPEENLFYIGDKAFILLGEFNDDASHYYVMSEDFYGDMAFDSSGYAAFDPQTPGNMGYFLNNEFLTDGNRGNMLPGEILEHIDYDHVWWTEGGLPGGDCESDYSFTAGVSLLSASEFMKYYGRFGWQPAGTSGNWWLRTQSGVPIPGVEDDNMMAVMGNSDANRGNAVGKPCTDSNFIRPVFFLDSEFFGEVALDAERVGANIVSILKGKYTTEELEELYTRTELENMGIIEREFELTFNTEQVAEMRDDLQLRAEVNVLTDEEVSEFCYQWLYETGDGSFEPIYKACGETYFLTPEDIGKTISLRVTPVMADGTVKPTLTTDKTYHVTSIGGVNRTAFTDEQKADSRYTPEENMFTVGGQQFILLNEYRDENSAYYVMAEDCYGRHVYDPDDTQRFDPEDENNIGYFLNNEFVTDGNEEQMLPQAIIEHINFSHVWQNEAGHSNGNCPSDYSFTAGIALISKTEYGKYFGKIGWDAPGEWWTRTARAKDANNMNIMAMTIGSGGGDIWDRNASREEIYIRPVFYLDRSFFADVRISDIGANVAQAMTDNYSLSELLSGGAGYTEEELEALGILKTPDAQNVMIEGNAAVNSVLLGSYTYSHELNKPEDGSIYGFEISSDNQSFSTAAENTFDYQVKGSDNGKYIRFFCTPVDSDGISGEKVVSNSILVSYTQDMAVTSITGDGIRDGKRLSELSSIAPVIEITNYSGETKQAVCIAAVYDANDRIIAMDSSVVEVTDTATVNGLSLSLSGLGSAAYARVFVVDSYADMNSLMGYEVVIR